MQVIHAFKESRKSDMNQHMKYWFGRPINDEYVGSDGSYMICYCGGILTPLCRDKDGITVGAVWHEREFNDREDD